MEGFIDTIATMHNGNTLAEIDRQMVELVQNVRSSGKKGPITVTLTVEPASKGTTDVLAVTDRVTVKAPNRERGASIYYPQEDGKLSRRDTRQQELPLRVLEMDKPLPEELREVGS